MNPMILLLFLANPIANALPSNPVPNGLDAMPGVLSSNLSAGLDPRGCFIPDAGKPQTPVIFADCATGIVKNQMSTYPDMDKFLIWSRFKTSTTDIKVPYVRYYETCALVLDVKKEDDFERDSFGDILHSAIILARTCVITPPHRGGQVDLGSRGRLQLTILRRPGSSAEEGGQLPGNRSGSLMTAGESRNESLVDVA
ncbi:MAG: hypothetical protein OHK93_004874 [Ramalina farinacea]|uniref:Uncharacterized protein n=1 Tax=Ramalina farinacea TaxID=258253 RepID=A0AA43QY69_9LECA|nr:hypothetical protein [Ramalina farinacea]